MEIRAFNTPNGEYDVFGDLKEGLGERSVLAMYNNKIIIYLLEGTFQGVTGCSAIQAALDFT